MIVNGNIVQPNQYNTVRCCGIDIHTTISLTGSFLTVVGVILFIVGIDSTQKPGPPEGPSKFSIAIICIIGILFAVGGFVALSALHDHKMLCISSNNRRLRVLGNDIRKVKYMSYSLGAAGIFYLLHSIVEVAKGNPNFRVRQWVFTAIISGLCGYGAWSISRYCRNEEELYLQEMDVGYSADNFDAAAVGIASSVRTHQQNSPSHAYMAAP
jgi:hypothetical protein